MNVKTIEEAKKIALKVYPDTKVIGEKELEKCFVINLVPKDYKEDSGIFIGGGTRVDKETGKVSLYNPILENSL